MGQTYTLLTLFHLLTESTMGTDWFYFLMSSFLKKIFFLKKKSPIFLVPIGHLSGFDRIIISPYSPKTETMTLKGKISPPGTE